MREKAEQDRKENGKRKKKKRIGGKKVVSEKATYLTKKLPAYISKLHVRSKEKKK